MCALIITNIRRIEKRTSVALAVPTVAPSNDHTDGSWTALDIYPGGLFINTTDKKVYTSDGIVIFEVGATSSAGLPDVLAVDNTTGGNNIIINTGDTIRLYDNTFYTDIASDFLTQDNYIAFPNQSGVVALLSDIITPTFAQVLAAGSSTGTGIILLVKPINEVSFEYVHNAPGTYNLDMANYARTRIILAAASITLTHGSLSGNQTWWLIITANTNSTITWATPNIWSRADGVTLPTSVLSGETWVLRMTAVNSLVHIVSSDKVTLV